MRKNYKQLEHLVLKYSFEKLMMSKEPEKLLNTLVQKAPEMIENAQNIELLAAAIIYSYLKRDGLNGRGGITAKDLALYFGVKAPNISQKVFDLESQLERGNSFYMDDALYEYIDDDRYEVNEMYVEFLESPDADDIKKSIKILQGIIKKDPDFFDPYVTLHEYYLYNKEIKKAYDILSEGYFRAMDLIDEEGRIPDVLHWGFLENRHIIRVLFNFATMLWLSNQRDEALAILLQLLKSNTTDNVGARYLIVAILEGYESNEHFEVQFETSDGFLDGAKLETWFYEKVPKYKKIMGWWLLQEDK